MQRCCLASHVAVIHLGLWQQRQDATAPHARAHASGASADISDDNLVLLENCAAVCRLSRPLRPEYFERQLRQMYGEKDAHVVKAEQEWVEGESTKALRERALVVSRCQLSDHRPMV